MDGTYLSGVSIGDIIFYGIIIAVFLGFLGTGGGSGNGEKNGNGGINTEKNDKIEKLYKKLQKETRYLEGLKIKVEEYNNEIEKLRYEGDEDLEKADINEIKIRKIQLKIEHLNEKIYDKNGEIYNIDNEIQAIR